MSTTQSFSGGNIWRLKSKAAMPRLQLQLVAREALIDSLDANGRQSLMLVTAPAGFGKSTLLAQWRSQPTPPESTCVWLTLDEDDREIKQFLAGLLFALIESGVELTEFETSVYQGTIDVPAERVVGRIVDALQHAGPTTLILDDYHQAENPALNQCIEDLLSLLPSHCQLVISTRIKPGLKLANRRLQGQLFELGEADLRFDRQAVGELFGDALNAEQCEELLARTQGWVAALQLAKIWGESKGTLCQLGQFSGRTEAFAEYLSEQVLTEVSGEEKSFLLETAVLEEVSVEAADFMRARSDSRYLLHSLVRLSPLVQVTDENKGSFHYHRLFRDFLIQQSALLGADRLQGLKVRAAQWYDQAGDVQGAVRLACSAILYDLAADCIDRAGGWQLCMLHGEAVMKNLLRLFPEEYIDQQPALQIYRIYLLIKQGSVREARQTFERLKQGVQVDITPRQMNLYVMELILSAYEDQHVDQSVIEQTKAALDQLPEDAHDIRAILYTSQFVQHYAVGELEEARNIAIPAIQYLRRTHTIYALDFFYYHLGVANFMLGDIAEAEANYHEGVRFARENFGELSGLVAAGQVLLAEILYQRNQLEDCRALLLPALEVVSANDGWYEVLAPGYLTAIRVTGLLNDHTSRDRLIEQGRHSATERGIARLGLVIEIAVADQLARQGSWLAAEDQLQQKVMVSLPADWKTDPFYWQIQHQLMCVQLRVAIKQQQFNEAGSLFSPAGSDGRDRPLEFYRWEWEAWKMLLEQEPEQTSSEAANKLNTLVSRLVPTGVIRPLLELGSNLMPVVRTALSQAQQQMLGSRHAEFLQRVIHEQDRLSEIEPTRPKSDILSPRELQVLVALEEGVSNKLIARQLDMTENTVKFHLKKIFKKLGVEKRTAAVKVARERGIL